MGVLVTGKSWNCHYWGSFGDEGADAGQQEQPKAENAGGGAVYFHLTF